jgi:hypothetical protein
MKLIPNQLLRSIIRLGHEPEEVLVQNLVQIRSEVEPGSIDKIILHFVGDLFDRTHSIPSFDLLVQHFKSLQDAGDGNGAAGVARLSQCVVAVDGKASAIPFLGGNDFRYQLDRFKADLMRDVTSTMLLQASTILTSGAQDRKGEKLIGPDAALDYIISTIRELQGSLKRGAIEGSFRRDAYLVMKQYTHLKSHPEDTVGVLTGINKLDVAHRGVRPGQLCLVAGFTSHLKTTLCLNWLYKAAVLFGRNVAIASLEMPVEDLRTSLYVMHSGHQRFADQGFKPLDYSRVTTGTLSPEEELFFDAVIADFENSNDYGEIFYKEPESSITIQEIQRWAEGKNRTSQLDMLLIDYLGLVDPGKGVSSLDSVAGLNKTIRQAKMLAMTFANGRGIPIVSPFQTNREGLKEAEKNGGRYKITALAGSNEAERSSDLIYYTYVDDTLRNSRELLVGNLKARKAALITEPFRVFADPSTTMIDNLDQAPGVDDLVQL